MNRTPTRKKYHPISPATWDDHEAPPCAGEWDLFTGPEHETVTDRHAREERAKLRCNGGEEWRDTGSADELHRFERVVYPVCPQRSHCLSKCLESMTDTGPKILAGVWGGHGEDELRRMYRRYAQAS